MWSLSGMKSDSPVLRYGVQPFRTVSYATTLKASPAPSRNNLIVCRKTDIRCDNLLVKQEVLEIICGVYFLSNASVHGIAKRA